MPTIPVPACADGLVNPEATIPTTSAPGTSSAASLICSGTCGTRFCSTHSPTPIVTAGTTSPRCEPWPSPLRSELLADSEVQDALLDRILTVQVLDTVMSMSAFQQWRDAVRDMVQMAYMLCLAGQVEPDDVPEATE